MANRCLIEFELPPVRYASQEGLVCFIGGDGELHRGTGMSSRLEFRGAAEGRNGVAGRTGRD